MPAFSFIFPGVLIGVKNRFKMKLPARLILGLWFLLNLVGCTEKLVPQRLNQHFEYQPSTAVTYDLRREGDSLHVFLRFNDKNFFAYPQNMAVRYAVYVDYNTNDKLLNDSLSARKTRFQKTEDGVYTNFKIPAAKLRSQAVLVLKIFSRNDPDVVIYKDIQLTTGNLQKPYVLVRPENGLPLFRNFVRQHEAFLVAQAGVPAPGELIRYEAAFEAALPPMATAAKTVEPTLKKLNTVPFLDQPLALPETGLYGISVGGKAVGGLLVESTNFPEVTSAKELIQPLIYITSSAERNKLYQATDPKAALDKFWLDISPNQNEARKLIRLYYERVVTANLLFTAHKTGWQTDRGMIYMIYGPADRVNRFNDREEWTYFMNEDHMETRFIFIKKDNTFTQNYYELLRSPYLEDIWYSMVEQWRKGTIAK